MDFNEDNLRAGLVTFTKPDFLRYKKAFENYSKEVAGGIPPEQAVDNALSNAVKGLVEPDEKLQTAREAAGISQQNSAQTSANTFIMSVFEEPEKKESWIRKWIEERDRNKIKTLKDPDAPIKARKSTMFWSIVIGIGMSFAFSWIASGIADLKTGVDWRSWFWLFFIPVCPLSVVFFACIGYRQAIRPRSTDAVEDEAIAQSSAQHTTQASGGHA